MTQLTLEEFNEDFKFPFTHWDEKTMETFALNFNGKYEQSRGVSVTVEKSVYAQVKVTVRWPGMVVPGVKLFTPSKDEIPIIQKYIWGLRPFPNSANAQLPNQIGDPSMMATTTTTTTTQMAPVVAM